MVFEQPIVARADTFSYSASPLTVVAASGLLNNDAVPPSCAGIALTFAVATAPANGTVVVSQAVLAQRYCVCEAASTEHVKPAQSLRTAVVACFGRSTCMPAQLKSCTGCGQRTSAQGQCQDVR
jgi:hypothetical protein